MIRSGYTQAERNLWIRCGFAEMANLHNNNMVDLHGIAIGTPTSTSHRAAMERKRRTWTNGNDDDTIHAAATIRIQQQRHLCVIPARGPLTNDKGPWLSIPNACRHRLTWMRTTRQSFRNDGSNGAVRVMDLMATY